MTTPHRVLEDAMERGNLPAEIRDELRVRFGYAQLLFCLDSLDVGIDPSEATDGDYVERDADVLPPGYYVLRDPDLISVYAPDDLLAFQVIPETADWEITDLAWDHERFGCAAAKEWI